MSSEPNSRVLSGFLDYLRIEKGLAPLTISAYSTDILQFAEFVEKRKRILLTARRSDVREFLQQLFSHQVDGRSVGRKLSALRHLYRYLLLDKKGAGRLYYRIGMQYAPRDLTLGPLEAGFSVQRAYEGPVLTAIVAPPLLAQPISDASRRG